MLKAILNNSFVKKLVKQKSKKEAHEYWKNPPDDGNQPEAYLNFGSTASLTEIFTEIIKKEINKLEKRIEKLELEKGALELRLQDPKEDIHALSNQYQTLSDTIEKLYNQLEDF